MAVYDNLPAYKAAYDLLLEVFKMNLHLTREHRYTLGEKLKLELIDLIKCIYRANSSEDGKEGNLKTAREHIVVVKLYMRMLHDLKQISLKRFVAMSERTEDLSKQLAAWHKSTAKRNP